MKKTKLKVFTNSDDAHLVWYHEKIQDCIGFAIKRKLIRNGETSDDYLENRVGFADETVQEGERRSSLEWPIQRYNWTDHGVGFNDIVRYQVIPVGTNKKPMTDGASEWSEPVTLSAKGNGPVSAYFNRGIVMSQFIRNNYKAITNIKKGESNDAFEQKLRAFLMGQLGARLLELLEETAKNKGHIYAALYELNESEIIGAFQKIGKRAHILLSDGSIKSKGEDQNADARAELNGKVDLYDRMICNDKLGQLGHNKYIVFCDKNKNPISVWTGSTNLTYTGLCTQVNNAILVEDGGVADIYLQHWHALKDSDSTFSEDLLNFNSTVKPGGSRTHPCHVWFTPTPDKVELEAARELIRKAQQGVLFLMFEPGTKDTLFNTIEELNAERPELYIHGVKNKLTGKSKDDENTKTEEAEVELVKTGYTLSNTYDMIQPEGIANGFAYWSEEITRNRFLGKIGWAIIHSKVVVIDPFSEHPVVITGSHNLGPKASSKNDENLFIAYRDKKLAEAYAVNIISVYNHYRWRAYLQKMKAENKDPWSGLNNSDEWQKRLNSRTQKMELEFWLNTNTTEI